MTVMRQPGGGVSDDENTPSPTERPPQLVSKSSVDLSGGKRRLGLKSTIKKFSSKFSGSSGSLKSKDSTDWRRSASNVEEPAEASPDTNRRKLATDRSTGESSITESVQDISATTSRKQSAHSTLRIFRLEDVEQEEEVGRGFFGVVYRGFVKSNRHPVAIKVIKAETAQEKANFLKEVTLLKSLKHPHLLRFLSVFVKSENMYLITEFLDGGHLRKSIKRTEKELPWSMRIKYGRDIADGMAFLHANKVIHRDLKSKNCLLTADGQNAIVADFGLATSLKWSDKSIVGSPYWMAPEMLAGKDYNEKVDVFSYGIILCELICRVKPDPDYLPRHNDFSVHFENMQPLINEGCPSGFLALCKATCEKNPSERLTFQQALERVELLTLTDEVKNPPLNGEQNCETNGSADDEKVV
eukprot:Clim_evm13s70 gene=Clim_evmTU13s70